MLITILAAAAAAAAPTSSKTVDELTACRDIADSTQRLACYDSKIATIIAAQKKGDIVIADRSEIRAAKKGLFGFTLPTIKLFSGGGEDEVQEIEAKLARASQDREGAWIFVTDTSGTWRQMDSYPLPINPKPGTAILIKRAALGSYKLQVGKYPGFRVRRIQ